MNGTAICRAPKGSNCDNVGHTLINFRATEEAGLTSMLPPWYHTDPWVWDKQEGQVSSAACSTSYLYIKNASEHCQEHLKVFPADQES